MDCVCVSMAVMGSLSPVYNCLQVDAKYTIFVYNCKHHHISRTVSLMRTSKTAAVLISECGAIQHDCVGHVGSPARVAVRVGGTGAIDHTAVAGAARRARALVDRY